MGRSPCCSKEAGLNRGSWTALEDKILTDHIKIHGEGRWRNLPQKAGLKRCGKSCRLRWLNYLRPDIKRGNISPDEEELIIRLHKLLGNRWSLIAGRLPGRTDNEIKNYWNTNLGKKVNPKTRTTTTRQSNKVVPGKRSPTPPSPTRVVRARAVKCTKVVLNDSITANPSSATSGCENPGPGPDPDPACRDRDNVDVDELFLADLLACDGYFGDTNYLSMPSYDHDHDLLFSEELTVRDHWGNIVNGGDNVGPTHQCSSFSTSFLCGEGDWLAAD